MDEFNEYVLGVPVLKMTALKVLSQNFLHWEHQPVLATAATNTVQPDGMSEYYRCLPIPASLTAYHQAYDSSLIMFPAHPESSVQVTDGFIISCVSPDCFQIATTLPSIGAMDNRNLVSTSSRSADPTTAFKPIGWVLDPAEAENERECNDFLWRTDDLVNSSHKLQETGKKKIIEKKEKQTVARLKTCGKRPLSASKCRETYSKVLQRTPRALGLGEQLPAHLEEKTRLKLKPMDRYNTKIFCNTSLDSGNGQSFEEGRTAENSKNSDYGHSDPYLAECDEENVSSVRNVISEVIIKHEDTDQGYDKSDSLPKDLKFMSRAEDFIEHELCSLLMESLHSDIVHCKSYSPSLKTVSATKKSNDFVVKVGNTLQ